MRIPEKVEKPVHGERREVLPFPRNEVRREKYLSQHLHVLREIGVGYYFIPTLSWTHDGSAVGEREYVGWFIFPSCLQVDAFHLGVGNQKNAEVHRALGKEGNTGEERAPH
ncbi:MAG: hypothetical protein V1885_02490 [Candidatus Brennerbacteria bacterium]